jgi:protein-disulfide isomerase
LTRPRRHGFWAVKLGHPVTAGIGLKSTFDQETTMPVFNRRLALAAALLGAVALSACNKGGGAVTADDMRLGDPNAKVTVIEYASASCPHCARWNADVFPAFKAKYIDTNKVNYVFREFITPPPQLAAAGALLARCTGKDKYFSTLDAVFHAQEEIYQSGDIRGPLLRIAQASGMSEEQFNACVSDDTALKAFNARVQTYVQRDKITSTPTFVINGKKLEGEQTLAGLDTAIAEASK